MYEDRAGEGKAIRERVQNEMIGNKPEPVMEMVVADMDVHPVTLAYYFG